jgi:hypothetical protein
MQIFNNDSCPYTHKCHHPLPCGVKSIRRGGRWRAPVGLRRSQTLSLPLCYLQTLLMFVNFSLGLLLHCTWTISWTLILHCTECSDFQNRKNKRRYTAPFVSISTIEMMSWTKWYKLWWYTDIDLIYPIDSGINGKTDTT